MIPLTWVTDADAGPDYLGVHDNDVPRITSQSWYIIAEIGNKFITNLRNMYQLGCVF